MAQAASSSTAPGTSTSSRASSPARPRSRSAATRTRSTRGTSSDPAQAGAEKIDYLLALHALLLGEHHAGRDSYGLTDLEANLLGLAIAEVYARCALTGEEPRELLLQEELERRYHHERSEGSVGIAEALSNLSMRLNNYIGEGPYAYLTDRPTTIPAGAPLVVFDTRSIPDAKAAAALFVICEYVKSQIARTRSLYLSGAGPRHAWAGRTFLVIDEAWKLIERPATGRWFNEFVRRSRHYALWMIAISQQLSDFDCEYGRALLANAAMRLFLRQETRELAYVREVLKLSEEAIDAISQLKTVRGAFSTAYLMNGSRGEGTLQIGVGPLEYWIASSDPARDEQIRRARAARDRRGRLGGAAAAGRRGLASAGGSPARGGRLMQTQVAVALLRERRVRAALWTGAFLAALAARDRRRRRRGGALAGSKPRLRRR